jgi:hypothetical protein
MTRGFELTQSVSLFLIFVVERNHFLGDGSS